MALVASRDDLLRDVLVELLFLEGLTAVGARDFREASACCRQSEVDVLVVDAIADAGLALRLLDDPWQALGERQPPFVLLASPETPSDLVSHAWVDRVLSVPVDDAELVGAVLYHATGRARRQMRSGVRARAAVDQTFQSKRATRQ